MAKLKGESCKGSRPGFQGIRSGGGLAPGLGGIKGVAVVSPRGEAHASGGKRGACRFAA